MSNEQGSYNNPSSSEQYSGEPVTNDNNQELKNEQSGQTGGDEAGDKELNLDSTEWGGMQSGAIEPGHKSTQSHKWLDTIPSAYRQQAAEWSAQRGVVKITPIEQRQKFTYSTVAYIAGQQSEPKTQIFPVVDVNNDPHQITWDFYDSPEGRIGVSNAVEKHQIVSFDVYLTELLATYWAFGDDDKYDYGLSTYPNMKRRWWQSVENGTYLDFESDIESTKEFIDFRNTFLQQHQGWVCRFASHTFGVFQGVIKSVKYTIGAGESFAKWTIEIAEAVFLQNGYSTHGKKEEVKTSDGSESDSGDSTSSETVETNG